MLQFDYHQFIAFYDSRASTLDIPSTKIQYQYQNWDVNLSDIEGCPVHNTIQFEPFYIFHVTKKVEEAPENKSDIFGNVVIKGDRHLIGYILSGESPRKKE